MSPATAPRVVVFDLDGVLADDEHRLPLLATDPDHQGDAWCQYYESSAHDRPLAPGLELFNAALGDPDTQVVVATARPTHYGSRHTADYRTLTRRWLVDHTDLGAGTHLRDAEFRAPVFMRAKGDRRRSHEVKLDQLRQIESVYGPVTRWYEGSPSNVDALRRVGCSVVWVQSKGWGTAVPMTAGLTMELRDCQATAATAATPPQGELALVGGARQLPTANDYQRWTKQTAVYNEVPGLDPLAYLACGLVGELGEFLASLERQGGTVTDRLLDAAIDIGAATQIVKKALRRGERTWDDLSPLAQSDYQASITCLRGVDDAPGCATPLAAPLTPGAREHLVKEAGDVMWYLARSLDEMGITLDEVLEANRAKLTSRKQRGVIVGAGDNR